MYLISETNSPNSFASSASLKHFLFFISSENNINAAKQLLSEKYPLILGLSESNAPIQEEPKLYLHGMDARLHNHKTALGHGLQFIRRHERPLHHLEGLAGIVLPLADGAAHDGAAAQGAGELLRRLASRREAAEDVYLMR